MPFARALKPAAMPRPIVAATAKAGSRGTQRAQLDPLRPRWRPRCAPSWPTPVDRWAGAPRGDGGRPPYRGPHRRGARRRGPHRRGPHRRGARRRGPHRRGPHRRGARRRGPHRRGPHRRGARRPAALARAYSHRRRCKSIGSERSAIDLARGELAARAVKSCHYGLPVRHRNARDRFRRQPDTGGRQPDGPSGGSPGRTTRRTEEAIS
jgi:hypothetical protein